MVLTIHCLSQLTPIYCCHSARGMAYFGQVTSPHRQTTTHTHTLIHTPEIIRLIIIKNITIIYKIAARISLNFHCTQDIMIRPEIILFWLFLFIWASIVLIFGKKISAAWLCIKKKHFSVQWYCWKDRICTMWDSSADWQHRLEKKKKNSACAHHCRCV